MKNLAAGPHSAASVHLFCHCFQCSFTVSVRQHLLQPYSDSSFTSETTSDVTPEAILKYNLGHNLRRDLKLCTVVNVTSDMASHRGTFVPLGAAGLSRISATAVCLSDHSTKETVNLCFMTFLGQPDFS